MIKEFMLLTAVFFASVSCTFGAELQVHWDFNELKNNSFTDRINGLEAAGPAGMDLKRFHVPGPDGKAFRFMTGKNPLKVRHHKAIDLKNDFTLELIFKCDRVNSFRCIFWKGDRTKKPEQVNFYIGIRDGYPEFKAKGLGGKWVVRTCHVKVREGQWNHLLVHWKNGKLKAKLNGSAAPVTGVDEDDLSRQLVSTPADGTFGQGAFKARPSFYFAGELDDLKIWRGDAMKNQIPDWDQKLKSLKKRLDDKKAAEKRKAENLQKELDRKISIFCGKNPIGYGYSSAAKRFATLKELFSSPVSSRAEIELANNEFETVQLFIFNSPGVKNKIKNISVSDLTGPGKALLPASRIKVGEVRAVTAGTADIPVDFHGAIPDVIFTDQIKGEIPENGMKTAALRIHADKLPAGLYRGTVNVSTDKGTFRIPLDVRVWNFALPERATLRSAFCFFEHFYRQWYGFRSLTKKQRLDIYNFLLDYRLSPCNIYESKGDHPALEDLKEICKRTNFVTFQGISKKLPLNAAPGAFAKTLEELKKMGLEDHIYFFSYDEIAVTSQGKAIPAARRTIGHLRKKLPALKCMQTSFPVPAIRDIFNVWCPTFDHFADPAQRALLEKLKRQGCEIWWYCADGPIKPFPNFFLDYPVFDCRIIGILSYMYDVKGILYWCINREWPTNMAIRKQWPKAPWKPWMYHLFRKTRVAKNGMGNFVYPGKNGKLLSSLRLENLRDGIEDHEYLSLLKRETVKLPSAHPLRRESEALLKVPAAVARSLTQYSQDPEHLRHYRRAVARMIVKVKNANSTKGIK